MTKRAFGDLEQGILNILQSGKRMTVKDVQELLNSNDKYTTIMTVMSRLADKKILGREKKGLRFEYWLLTGKQTPVTILERLKARLFGLKTVEAVSYLLDGADDLTKDDLEQMEKLIAEAKKRKSK